MANLAIGDLVEVRAVAVLGDQIGINIYHYLVTDRTVVVGEVTTADMAAAFSAQVHTQYKAAMSQVASWYGAGARTISPVVSIEDGWAGEAGVGTVAFDPLPLQTAGLLAMLTGIGGRANRGRRYLPFPALNAILSTGKPTTAYRNLIAAIGNQYLALTTVTGAGGTFVDLSPVLRHADLTATAITSVSARANWGTQRSRGGYGRPNIVPVWPP